MQLRLRYLADGEAVYIDANIFNYVLSDHRTYGEVCYLFLEGVMTGKYSAYTSILSLDEVSYVVLKGKVAEELGIDFRAVTPKLIKKNISVVKKIMPFVIETVSAILSIENLTLLPANVLLKVITLDFMSRYYLLPRDAIHVATMHEFGITNIATNDPDFERVEWLKVWKP